MRNLLISLEDLSLPMESYPSELLHPWALKELSHESNHTNLPLSVTPEPESGSSELLWQPPTPKPTHDDGRVKPLAVSSPTVSTLLNGGSNSPMMPRSAFPTPTVDKSEPIAEIITSTQAAITRVSSPEASFALTLSSQAAGDLAVSTMSRLTRRQTGDVELNVADVHSFTDPATSSDRPPVIDYSSDQASTDPPIVLQSQKEKSCNAGSAVDVPLPEQTVAEIDTLGKNSDNISEEVQKDHKEEGKQDITVAVEEVSMESKAPRQWDGDLTATVEEGPTESQAFEVAIRGLVDPDGSSGSSLDDLVTLVAGVLKGRAEAEEKLKSETIRYNREVEDLRYDWIDQRGHIENVINGQNDFACEKGIESNRLFAENSRLDRENLELKEQLKDQEEQHKRDVEILEAEKQYAENSETTALADVEGRISREKQRHEKERIDAVDRHTQEINSQICLRQMALDELDGTRTRLNTAENKHEDTIKDNYRTIRRLKADITRMEPAVAAAVERETSTKDRLEKELEDQRKDKDSKINLLKKRLRESKNEARSLKNNLITLDSTAEMRQHEIQRLSTRHDEEKASLREDRDHIVGDLRRDKEGLERTIRNDEAEIKSLKMKITEFESGDAVRNLQSQIQVLKTKLRRASKEAKDLRRSSEAQESKRSEEVKRASDEKAGLEHQLAELKAQLAEVTSSKECQHRTAQEVKEQKEKLSHELQAAEDREQEMRAHIQRVQDEKRQITTQHQDAIKEKEEVIRCLHEKGQITTQHQDAIKEKEEVIRCLQQKVQDQWRESVMEHETIVKGKDEQICRLQQAVQTAQTAKNGETAKIQDLETQAKEAAKIQDIETKAKEAAEKAAKDAADAVEVLQHQLNEEKQSSRNAQDKATETETNLRKEISALKSEVGKVEERQSHTLVSDQAGKEAREKALLLVQANEANNLLFEIGKTGLVQGSPEHFTLCELNEAKLELHKIHYELRKPNSVASKRQFVSSIAGLNMNEERIQQFSTDTPQLVKQVNRTNARLRRLQNILDTNADVQKDAMLEALEAEVPNDRVIRKPRALKRPDKPDSGMLPQSTSTGGQAGNASGQSQQTHGLPAQLHVPHLSTGQQNLQLHSQAAITPAQTQGNAQAQSGAPANGPAFPSQAMPKRDHRQPFMSLLASISPTPVIQVQRAPRQEPAVEEQPLVSGALGDNLRPVSPRRPIRSTQGQGSQLAHSPSAGGLKKDNKKPIPQMPEGWTEEMTDTVRFYHRDTIDVIDLNVKMAHDFDPQDNEGYQEWLKKLQSDFKVPGERPNRYIF